MNKFWIKLAAWVSQPRVADWIISRAQRTPYWHLTGYMNRWWLFNPYQDSEGNVLKRNWMMRQLPSIRVHHILRPDNDRDLHDHPWNFRTIVLRGWYKETRRVLFLMKWIHQEFMRNQGDTATLEFRQCHAITDMPEDGVWTLFITFRKQGTWGFMVRNTWVEHGKYNR